MSDEPIQIVKINQEDKDADKRRSPVQSMLDRIPDGYLTYHGLAARYGLHQGTVRRLIKSKNPDGTPKFTAPSEAIVRGGLTIYLFNETDIAEIDKFMAARGHIQDSTKENM